MTEHPDDVDVVVAKLVAAGMPDSCRLLVGLIIRIMHEQGWLVVPPSERSHSPPPIPKR